MFSSLIRRKRPRSEMTFLEHIDDLRISLLRVFFTLFIGIGIALIYYEKLPHLLGYPLLWAKDPATSPIGILLGAADPTMQTLGELKEFTFMGVWSVMFYAAFAAGIALASPVLLYEIVRFVGPALTTREKRGLIPFCLSALILFLAGATLAFLWLTPMSIKVWHHFASGMGIAVTWQASDYFGFVIMMSLLTGLSFQFPLALIILMWLEIVRPITLLRKWRIMLFCIVLIVVLLIHPLLILFNPWKRIRRELIHRGVLHNRYTTICDVHYVLKSFNRECIKVNSIFNRYRSLPYVSLATWQDALPHTIHFE
jgi:sec-independent protein translocase protein TatC